jgi:hypothetical protein
VFDFSGLRRKETHTTHMKCKYFTFPWHLNLTRDKLSIIGDSSHSIVVWLCSLCPLQICGLGHERTLVHASHVALVDFQPH